MARLRLASILLIAVVFAALGVFGIVRYHDSPGGVISMRSCCSALATSRSERCAGVVGADTRERVKRCSRTSAGSARGPLRMPRGVAAREQYGALVFSSDPREAGRA
jgi:hypothetical protein